MQYNKDRLTNIRYADDILLFGKSLNEITDILKILRYELRNSGLELHPDKTKIITTTTEICPEAVDIEDISIEYRELDIETGYNEITVPK